VVERINIPSILAGQETGSSRRTTRPRLCRAIMRGSLRWAQQAGRTHARCGGKACNGQADQSEASL